jgi:hypothetical protein
MQVQPEDAAAAAAALAAGVLAATAAGAGVDAHFCWLVLRPRTAVNWQRVLC